MEKILKLVSGVRFELTIYKFKCKALLKIDRATSIALMCTSTF